MFGQYIALGHTEWCWCLGWQLAVSIREKKDNIYSLFVHEHVLTPSRCLLLLREEFDTEQQQVVEVEAV